MMMARDAPASRISEVDFSIPSMVCDGCVFQLFSLSGRLGASRAPLPQIGSFRVYRGQAIGDINGQALSISPAGQQDVVVEHDRAPGHLLCAIHLPQYVLAATGAELMNQRA
jgi:hypothetical protein